MQKTKKIIPWTDCLRETWPIWVFKHLVPKSKMASTGGGIMTDGIICICHPVRGRSNVNIQSGTRWLDEYAKVIPDHVANLDTILHEKCIAYRDIKIRLPRKENGNQKIK